MTTIAHVETPGLEVFPELEQASAETVLRWGLDTFSPQVALAYSFHAEESVPIALLYFRNKVLNPALVRAQTTRRAGCQ